MKCQNLKTLKKYQRGNAKALFGNKKIINNVRLLITGFIIIVVSIIVLLVKTNRVTDIKEILIESFIILIFIALTEFGFLSFFGSKFISINTNQIKLNIVKYFQNYSNSSKNLHSNK